MKSEIVACGRMFLFAAIFCLGAWLPARGQDQPTVYPQLGHIGQICAAGFIDGGHTLLSGGSDGIRVWDVATGREGLSPGILGCKLAWSARSEIVATWHGQDEDHIRVYDARSKQLLLTAPFGTGGQIAFALSPDGRELAVGEKQSADRGGELRSQGLERFVRARTCRLYGRQNCRRHARRIGGPLARLFAGRPSSRDWWRGSIALMGFAGRQGRPEFRGG